MNCATYFLDRQLSLNPDRVAVVGAFGHSFTYGTLSHLSDAIVAMLQARKCQMGDRVVVIMTHSPQSIASFFAVLKLGAIAVLVADGLSAKDYEFYVQDVGAEFIVVDYEAQYLREPFTSDVVVKAIEIDDGLAAASARARLSWIPSCAVSIGAEAPALILYTSGSMANQKAVVHSHGSLAASLEVVGCDAFAIQPGDMVLCLPRLSFAYGLTLGLLIPFALGATIVRLPNRSIEGIMVALRRLGPHILCAVPSVLNALLKTFGKAPPIAFSCLRFVMSAGEPLPPALYDAFRERFDLEVLDGFGSTELLTHVIVSPPGRSVRGSCGVALRGVDVQITDERDSVVADGTIGHVRVKSRTAFLGYWRDYVALGRRTEELVHTGDMMYRTSTGYFFHCGRKDDTCKILGLWVRPAEIESILWAHPFVEKCAVVAREDRNGLHKLVAYMVVKQNHCLAECDLYRYAAERLPNHMVPSLFIEVEDLPVTINGKIKRQALPTPMWK